MINLPSLIEPDKDFWSRLVVAKTKNFGPFEGPLYFLHVHAMKEESEDPLYTKYRVLDVERELKKTGLGRFSWACNRLLLTNVSQGMQRTKCLIDTVQGF
jgi:hypothetical protein